MLLCNKRGKRVKFGPPRFGGARPAGMRELKRQFGAIFGIPGDIDGIYRENPVIGSTNILSS
jgi:hypothetical protein